MGNPPPPEGVDRPNPPPIPPKPYSQWDAAIDTIASMCISYKLGNGPSKETIISTLRIYADGLERLINDK